MCNARRILHRACAADGHDELLVLQTRPGDLPILDQVDLDGGGGGDLDRDATELAVALGPVAIAEIEIGMLVMDRKIDDGPRRTSGRSILPPQ